MNITMSACLMTKVFVWLFVVLPSAVCGQSSTCSPPSPPDDSRIIYPQPLIKHNNGSIVLFGCKEGFYLVGVPIVRCIGNTWTTIKFRCLGFCPKVSHILNGKAVSVNPKVGQAAVAFHCNKNHRLIGKPRLECINGRWNGVLPFCQKLKSCIHLRSPVNGTLHGTDTSHGVKATFACLTGFDLFGSPTLTCSDGVWSASVPTCKARCMKITDPLNGRKHGSGFSHGATSSFKCNVGYELVGSRILLCRDGMWNSSVPVCKAMLCRKPAIPENSYIIFPGIAENYVHGTKLFLGCHSGYYLVGYPITECNQTVWLKMDFRCIASCPVLGPLKNGIISHVTLRDGGEVEIKCLTNYTLDGSSNLVCRDGRWNDSLPSCGAPCNEPLTPKHGWRLGEDFRHGRSVKFYCNKGYHRVGTLSTRCNDGTWDNHFPSCKAQCNDPGSPANGNRRGDIFRHSSWVQFLCDANYQLDGEEWIQCVDGSWSASVPKCIGDCGRPRTSSRVRLHGNRYLDGDNVTFSCFSNTHDLFGKATLHCVDQAWDFPAPECKERCQNPKLLIPKNGWLVGNNFAHGGAVTVYCKFRNGSLDLSSKFKINCNNGSWSRPLRTCKVPCNNPGKPRNGTKHGDDYRSGAKVTFSCDNPFELVGSPQIVCRDGKWSDSTPTCSKCGRPLGMENNRIQDSRISSLTSSHVSRLPKYARLNGPSSWCSNVQTYLQIDFGRTYKVTAIATQGGAMDSGDKWVKQYKVTFYAGATQLTYSESGLKKTIQGNRDASSVVRYQLKEPFVTRRLRIHPVSVTKPFCLRVEIYGCDPNPECILPGTMFYGFWAHRDDSNNYFRAFITNIDHTHIDYALEVNNSQKRKFKKTDPVLIINKIPEMNGISVNAPVIAVYIRSRPEWYRTGKVIGINVLRSLVFVKFDDGLQRWVPLKELVLVRHPRFC